MYRRLGLGLVAATIVVAAALPAVAAEQATMLSPTEGDVVTGKVTLRVRVDTHPVEEVTLRLSRDGSSQATGTASIPLPCVEDCEGNSSTIWGNRTFDPTAGAPFSAAGVCNGKWVIQGRLDKGQWTNLANVVFSAPPMAPSNVKVIQGDGIADLTWSASRTPDVIGYRVERQAPGTDWVVMANLTAADTRYQDQAVSEGTYSYRVIAMRPDGIVNGNPAAPCADRDSDYEAASKEATLAYREPEPTPSPSPSQQPTGNPSGDPSGNPSSGPSEPGGDGSSTGGGTNGSGSSGGSADPSDPSATPSPSATDGTTTTGDSTGSYRPGRSRTVKAPPAAHRQTDTRITAPGLAPGAEPPPETYYGQDGGVGELDYSGADAIVGQEIVGYDENGQPIYKLVPGALQETGISILDAGKMRAIAMGLLLVAVALHSRRWMLAG